MPDNTDRLPQFTITYEMLVKHREIGELRQALAEAHDDFVHLAREQFKQGFDEKALGPNWAKAIDAKPLLEEVFYLLHDVATKYNFDH